MQRVCLKLDSVQESEHQFLKICQVPKITCYIGKYAAHVSELESRICATKW